MIITQSHLAVVGSYAHSTAQSTQVDIQVGTAAPTEGNGNSSVVAVSSHASTLLQINASTATSILAPEKLAIWLIIKALIKRLTGRDVDLSQVAPATASDAPTASTTPASTFTLRATDQLQTSSEVDFQAVGAIKTADGRTIDIRAQLSLEQTTSSQGTTTLGNAPPQQRDPLVINFGTPSAALTAQRYQFDLLGNGQLENIPFTASGSGFLVLDKNGNGAVDNGTELFGPASGNGFADLAKYDSDRNGWIDANDPVWSSLKVWTKDATGRDQLLSLSQLGIGAISLDTAATQFTLTDSRGQQEGTLRGTGIFLREDGSSGTVQQVDLSV